MRTEVVVNTRPIELTAQAVAHTLNKETNIFMPDIVKTEVAQPTRAEVLVQPVRPQSPDGAILKRDISQVASILGEKPSAEQLRAQWTEALGKDLQNPDTRRTVDAAVRMGLSPDAPTSKGKTEQTAREVIENASIDDAKSAERAVELFGKERLTQEERQEVISSHGERLKRAEKVLGRELSEFEKVAILKAHYEGFGEEGKNGEQAGVFNYKKEQLAKKARDLKEAGFNEDERRQIIESGLAAANPPPQNNPHPIGSDQYYEWQIDQQVQALQNFVNPAGNQGFTNPTLERIRQEIISRHDPARNNLTREWIDAFGEEVYSLGRRRAAPPTEIDTLQEVILNLSRIDDLKTPGRAREENEFLGKFKDLTDTILQAGNNQAQAAAAEQARREYVTRYVSTLNPSASGIPDAILHRIISADYPDGRIIERLVFRIIGVPLQSETSDYNLGFYGGINIDAITNLLQTLSQTERVNVPNTAPPQIDVAATDQQRDRRRHQLDDIKNLIEAVRHTHEINALVTTHSLDAASQRAPNLLPRYLQRLHRLKGVGTMMRLLESGHLELLSKNGYIDSQGYAEMMDKSQNKVTGSFEPSQPDSLYSALRKLAQDIKNNPQTLQGVSQELRDVALMEDWEISVAFNLARDLYNNEHRSAELASWGRVPGGDMSIESAPFEGFLKIFNPGMWLLDRFKPGGDRGGPRWFDRLMDAMQRRKHIEGYGHSDIVKIKGDEVRKFELPAIAGIRGYWSSWKAKGGLLKQVDVIFEPRGAVQGTRIIYGDPDTGKSSVINPGVASSQALLGEMLDTGRITFIRGNEKISWNKASDEMKVDYLKSVFYEPGTTTLRRDLRTHLGVVYRIALGPDTIGHNKQTAMNELKEDVRRQIWERMAEDNPLAILPYLHGMQYKDGRTVLGDIYQRPGWNALNRKLMILNEMRLAKIKGVKDPNGQYLQGQSPILNYTLENAISDAVAQGNAALTITQAERAMLDEIKSEGMQAAHHLANIKFAFIPFANDVIFERADFEHPGEESMGRHFRDIAQINGSTGALVDAMDNLGQINDFHKLVEFIMKFGKGITAVHGDKFAKERAMPVIDATVAFFRRGEDVFGEKEDYPGEENLSLGRRIKRWIKEQDEVDWVRQKMKKHNSEAQMFYHNVHMLALDRGQTYEAMEELLAAGIIGHHEEEEFQERFGGKKKGPFSLFIFRMMLEGFMRGFKGGVTVATSEVLKKGFNPKGAVS